MAVHGSLDFHEGLRSGYHCMVRKCACHGFQSGESVCEEGRESNGSKRETGDQCPVFTTGERDSKKMCLSKGKEIGVLYQHFHTHAA